MISQHLAELLQHFGYGFVFLIIMLEAMGLPLPGESMLIASALYAATTHKLDIFWLIPIASAGAIIGDNLGYLIGKWAGIPLLGRYGKHVGLTEDRLKLGQFLFRKHGGIIVFLGRFIAILRTFVALLAGANHMHWARFLAWNAVGGIVWCGGYSMVAYFVGNFARHLTGPIGIAIGIIGVIIVVTVIVFLKKNEKRLTRAAQEEMKNEPLAKS